VEEVLEVVVVVVLVVVVGCDAGVGGGAGDGGGGDGDGEGGGGGDGSGGDGAGGGGGGGGGVGCGGGDDDGGGNGDGGGDGIYDFKVVVDVCDDLSAMLSCFRRFGVLVCIFYVSLISAMYSCRSKRYKRFWRNYGKRRCLLRRSLAGFLP